MHVKSGGQFGELAEQFGKFFNFHAGVRFVGGFRAAGEIAPDAAVFRRGRAFVGAGGLQLLLQFRVALGAGFYPLPRARHFFEFKQMFEIAFAHIFAFGDFAVKQRLREAPARRFRCGPGGGSHTCQ